MKRAARLLPIPQASSSRSTLLLRPSLLPCAANAIPGPSRSLRFASTSAPQTLTQTPQAKLSSNEAILEEADVEEEITEEEMKSIKAAAEEDVTSSLEEESGLQIHTKPSPGGPIILPVSSLASSNPTEPGPKGLAISLPSTIFNAPLRRDILHQAVVWYRSTMRQGTHAVRGRSDVNFSGKKLRPQKGTGRSRMADRSSPILKGGGMAHYKRPRDYAQLLPRKVRALAMRIALSSKLKMGLLRVVEDINEAKWSGTSEASRSLSTTKQTSNRVEREGEVTLGRHEVTRFGLPKKLSVLFVHSPLKPAADVWAVARVLRNIPGVEVMSTDEVEVYHILKYKWLVLEGEAVDMMSTKKGMGSVQEYAENEWEDVESVGSNAEDVMENVVNVDETSSLIQPEGEVSGLPGVVDTSGEVSAMETEPDQSQMGTKIPKGYLINRWRKIRGAKSMRKTFGTKNATIIQVRSNRTFKRLRRDWKLEGEAKKQTVDMVLREMHKRHSEEWHVRTQ